MGERNWAGNVTYGAREIHRPRSVEELQALVAGSERIRVLGSRHSFNEIADSPELVSLRALPPQMEIDAANATVSCSSALTYGELAPLLHAGGFALANLGSLPHISLAGAISTATHGSGNRLGNLATSVAALQLVGCSGELLTLRRGERDFDGAVVALGSLGAITRVTLDVEPAYYVSQVVYEELPWRAVEEHFDELSAAGDSVSVFTLWGGHAGQLWVKRRDDGSLAAAPPELFGARAAIEQLHPIAGGDPRACTPQLGVPGPWYERLPHFRLDFTPSAGEELQSEYLLDRADAAAATTRLRALAADIRPLLHVSEIRTIAADSLWLSPQYRRDSVAIHFTWKRDQDAVERLLPAIEAALEPFAPRPHWGKLFAAGPQALAARYERLPDFAALLEQLDPRGAFRNAWLEQRVLG
ncbi:MAG TPA: D-arabinono-1,4-lactone oxidase [Solirubrobacteraceae bacterium]|nr:D-arabinono-1,4-lactone oxidase [Solirubrobacteraceae bacterium]